MPSVHELSRSLESAQARIRNIKHHSEAIARRTVDVALGGVTGIGVGLLDYHYGETNSFGVKKARLPGTAVDLDVVIAVGASLLGVSGMAGNASDEIVAIATASSGIAGWTWAYETSSKSKTP